MKYTAFIAILLVTSCASHRQPPVAVVPAPYSAPDSSETLRYEDILRPYYVGRSADPNHPDVMAEAHPVYRVEVSSRWNLHPGGGPLINQLNPHVDAAFSPRPANDAIAAEMNQQRELTRQVIQQAEQLSQSYRVLQQALGEIKTVVSNTAAFDMRLTAS